MVLMVLSAPAIAHSTLAMKLSPVLASSMAPGLEPEDVIASDGIPATSIQRGDVIAAQGQATGKQVAHQDVAVTPASALLRVTTEGAANPEPDFDPVMLQTIAHAVDHRARSRGNRSHQGDRIPAHHQAWQIMRVPDGDRVALISQGHQVTLSVAVAAAE
jgi:hypothetical protein